MFRDMFNRVQTAAANDLTLVGLKTAIIAWCLIIIVLTLSINNKLALGAILAYEILP